MSISETAFRKIFRQQVGYSPFARPSNYWVRVHGILKKYLIVWVFHPVSIFRLFLNGWPGWVPVSF